MTLFLRRVLLHYLKGPWRRLTEAALRKRKAFWVNSSPKSQLLHYCSQRSGKHMCCLGIYQIKMMILCSYRPLGKGRLQGFDPSTSLSPLVPDTAHPWWNPYFSTSSLGQEEQLHHERLVFGIRSNFRREAIPASVFFYRQALGATLAHGITPRLPRRPRHPPQTVRERNTSSSRLALLLEPV